MVDRLKLGERLLYESHARGTPRLADVVDVAVIAVIADISGIDRAEPEAAVEPALRDIGERGVRRRHGCGGRAEAADNRRGAKKSSDNTDRMTTRDRKHVHPPVSCIMAPIARRANASRWLAPGFSRIREGPAAACRCQ